MKIIHREPSNTLPRTEILTVQPTGFSHPLWVTVTVPERASATAPRGQITLDGNTSCGTVFNVSTYLEMEGHMPATVQVAVGYPLDHPVPAKLARNTELTPTAWPDWDEPYAQIMGRSAQESGRADRFLSFLVNELKPYVEAEHGVDPSEWTLAGHSLGGLFTTHALFANAAEFKRYFAVGSSFWWQAPMMLDRASAFAAGDGHLDVAVFLAAGDGESKAALAKLWAPMSEQPAWKRYLEVMGGVPDIVADTRSMAERIARRSGVRVRCDIAVNESHGSAVFIALSQGLRWLNASVGSES